MTMLKVAVFFAGLYGVVTLLLLLSLVAPAVMNGYFSVGNLLDYLYDAIRWPVNLIA